jgi:hypothetical protein
VRLVGPFVCWVFIFCLGEVSLSILLPLQSLELAMSAGCFSLLLARHSTKDGMQCAFAATAAAIVVLLVQHFVLREVFPTIGVSLAVTIATGLLTVFAIKLPKSILLPLSVIYGAVFGASAYEILFYAMNASMVASIACYIGLAGFFGANVLARFSHPTFEVFCRVGASWIVAASILMSAFFI